MKPFLQHSIILTALTIISRISGLVRELFIASLFGCNYIADCINVAWRLPNLFRRILGEGALSSVFIPIFSFRISKSREEAEKFFTNIFLLLTLLSFILVIIFEYFMPEILQILAPGFVKNSFQLAILLCRITMPYLLCISQVAIFGAMLNSINRFAYFAFSPIILNFGIIIFTLILNKNSINFTYAISYSLVLSGILQVIFMYIGFKRSGFKLSIFLFKFDYCIKKFLFGMVSSVTSSGVVQLQSFISQAIISFIPGSIAILTYAERLYQLPLSLIGTTLSTILLPTLSKYYQVNNNNNTSIEESVMKIGLLLSLPCAMGLISLSYPIVNLIYERGMFTQLDTIHVAKAVKVFGFGLPFFIMIKILMAIFYAKQELNTPLITSIISLVINTTLNIYFTKYYGYIGIAIGSCITSLIHTFILALCLKIKNNVYFSSRLLLFVILLLGLVIFFGIITSALFNSIGYDYSHYSIAKKITILSIAILINAILYILLTYKVIVKILSSLRI